MLQWMGGSRRKVTTPITGVVDKEKERCAGFPKSTEKRQKQYFEQRRRQQQLQDSVGSSYFEGGKTCSKHAENNRSLDILCLQNLSAAGLEYNSSCFREARDNSVDDDRTIPLSPKIQSAQVIPLEPTEIEEPRTSSSYSMGTVFPKITARRPVEALGRHQKASNTADVKTDLLKSDSQQRESQYFPELSVVDMLCDDEPSSCINQSLEREAHVAFSIEGLGKVEIETPVHSPKTPSRTHHQSSPSPLKAATYSFTGLNSELVNLEFDSCTDAPLDRSFMKSSCSRDRVHLSKPNKKLFGFDEFSLFNDDNNNLSDLLGGDKLYGRSTQRNNNIWDDLPGDKVAKRGFDFSDKICMDEMDASDDFWYSMHGRKDRLAFEGCEWQDDRSTMRKACKFDPEGSPVPDIKYNAENFPDLGFSDMKWKSGVARSHDTGDLQYKPRSCFTYKEAREEESLLSEESCSSTAVRGVDKKTAGNNSEGNRTMRCSMNIRNSESICSERKMSSSLSNSSSLKEESMIPTPLYSESVPLITASPLRVKRENAGLFGADYEPAGFDSKTSGTMSSSCKFWLEDMFDTPGNIKFSEGSSFERLGMPQLPQKTDTRQRSGKLFRAQDDLVHEDEITGIDKYENQDFSMIDSLDINVPQREILSKAKSSSSENGNSTAASVSVLDHLKETPKENLKTRNKGGEVSSPEAKEEKSPTMETSSILDGKHDVFRCQRKGQTSPLFQTGFGGIKDSGPAQRMTINEGKKSTSSSPCQILAVSYNIFAFRF